MYAAIFITVLDLCWISHFGFSTGCADGCVTLDPQLDVAAPPHTIPFVLFTSTLIILKPLQPSNLPGVIQAISLRATQPCSLKLF